MASLPDQVPIWLDCDTGHDDAYAILLAAYHPNSRLLGISTVHGNAPLSHTTNNTLSVLEAIGAQHVTVVKGKHGPIERHPSFAPDIHGASGLDGVTLLREPHISPSQDTVEDVVQNLLSEPAGTVHLVATGPLTNIAGMLLSDPRLADHLAGLSIMGGAVGSHFTDAPLGSVEGQGERFGNWSPWAEFNIYADPDAAKVVFSNQTLAAKTTLIPLDLTHQVRGVQSVQDLLFGKAKWESSRPGAEAELPILRRLFQEVLTYFSSTYASHFAITDGPPLHDPLAVWAALHPAEFNDGNSERWTVTVDVTPGKYHMTQDPQNHRGQTVIQPSNSGQGVRIPRSLNIPRFWAAIDEALSTAAKANGSFQA